jgi:hypothetical protein
MVARDGKRLPPPPGRVWLFIFLILLIVVVAVWYSGWMDDGRTPAEPEVRRTEEQPSLFAGRGLTESQLRALAEKGMANPMRDIIEALTRRPDLIPYEGVLGGTMHFVPGESHVLSDRWVFATFEDGHVNGHMLLEYEVSDDGSVSWQVIDAYLN